VQDQVLEYREQWSRQLEGHFEIAQLYVECTAFTRCAPVKWARNAGDRRLLLPKPGSDEPRSSLIQPKRSALLLLASETCPTAHQIRDAERDDHTDHNER